MTLATMTEVVGESKSKHDVLAHQRRIGFVVVSCISTVMFVGAMFGWGPMQLMLEREGVFHERCSDYAVDDEESSSSGNVCPAQTSALLKISLIAQLTQFVSPLLGYIIDRYSPCTLAYCMIAFHTVGLALVILALSKRWHSLLYLAFSLLAIHTWMGGMLLINIGLYFKERTRVVGTSLLNALFDAAGVTYLALWAIDNVWKDLTMLMVVYFELSALVYGVSLYYWTVTTPVADDDSTKAIDGKTETNLVENDSNYDETSPDAKDPEEPTGSKQEVKVRYVLVADRSQFEQLTSTPYWVLIAFFALHIVSTQWTSSTIRDFLAELGDDEYGNRYLTIFTLLNPVSLLGLPFVDQVVQRYGYHGGFQVINILCFGYTLVKIVSTNLNVQIIGFVLFSFYRCFLFSITFSFLPTFLSFSVVGKGTGIIFFVVAILSVLNIPLADWAVERLDSFFWPNLMWTILVIPCIFSAWYLGKFSAWEDQHR